jgi:hypothetical protein
VPLTLLDYPVARESAPFSLTEFPTVLTFDTVPSGYIWRVDQVACGVLGFSENEAQGAFFENVAPPYVLLFDQPIAAGVLPIQGGPLILWGTPGEGGALYNWDDQGSPLTIQGGNALSIAFYYNASGLQGQAVARVQYQYFQGSPGQATPAAGLEKAPTIPVGI